MNIETNIGQEFLNILGPVMKRNKVKVSFRTMKNMDQIISSHNIRVQNPERSEDAAPKPHCNCQRARKSECPLPDQDGRVESVVYRAKIQREDTGATEFYTELTGSLRINRYKTVNVNFDGEIFSLEMAGDDDLTTE